jgi:glycosyltransferase involved in cell wall biosynthesis
MVAKEVITMIDEKKVSIVIPAYKPMFFLQTLKSALGQTYTNTEIIVSDNCPTNEIKNICSMYPTVKYKRNSEIGYLNVLSSLYECEGDYIKPLFDDDILHPFCVQRMVKSVENSEFSFIFSASQVINIFNEPLWNRIPLNENSTLNYDQITRAMILNFNNFVGELSTIMINRRILNLIRPESISVFGDHDCRLGLADVAIYLKLAEKSTVFYVNEILSYFRRDDRYESNSRQDAVNNPNFIFVITDWIDLLIQSHIMGVVNDSELRSMSELVTNQLGFYNSNYPEVAKHELIYKKYVNQLIKD